MSLSGLLFLDFLKLDSIFYIWSQIENQFTLRLALDHPFRSFLMAKLDYFVKVKF